MYYDYFITFQNLHVFITSAALNARPQYSKNNKRLYTVYTQTVVFTVYPKGRSPHPDI